MSWEAESAPSSEQEREWGDREPGRTPLPAQAVRSWVPPTRSTAWGRVPGTSLPSSARLPGSGGLALNSPLGELQRGGEQATPMCNALGEGGGCGNTPSLTPHFISGKAS